MSESVLIAHISDVHLGPLRGFHPRYWNLKRGLGVLNWHRSRKHVHLRSIADAIAADAKAQKPDHIVVTGDLANLGLPAEYHVAHAWLEQLGEPRDVSVVPGNHDVYTARLHGASCLRRWQSFMTSDEWGADFVANATDGFPFVRRVGPAAIVGLNSAVPTPPFVAAGKLGTGQLAALAATLDGLAATGLVRIVLIHHPPLPGQAPGLRGLADAAEFQKVIRTHGAELVLHGHNHRDMLVRHKWVLGEVPIIGVASGSAGRAHKSEPLGRYNLYRVAGHAAAAQIEMCTRGLAAMEGPIVELSRFILG